MTFCPDSALPISDPVENDTPGLGETPSEMSPASEQEASALHSSWDLTARIPNCS